MKVAICEDNEQDLILFKELCEQYSYENKKQIDIISFASGEDLLKEYCPHKYDVIFLDIYMKDLTGVDTAKKIRQIDEDIKIIFTTTSDEYYGDGFAVEATHYLIKPLNEEKVKQAMYRLRDKFDENDTLLVLSSGMKSVEIPQSTIMYIVTIRNGIEVHCKNEVVAIRTTLAKAIEQLTDKCFLKCHRYSIVNLRDVVSVNDDTFLMSDGKQILIRKSNKKEIAEAYHKYRITKLRGENQ